MDVLKALLSLAQMPMAIVLLDQPLDLRRRLDQEQPQASLQATLPTAVVVANRPPVAIAPPAVILTAALAAVRLGSWGQFGPF